MTNKLALTPPMGWNSWNAFGELVDEKVIRETADLLVSSGLQAAGYTYLVIDDFWHGGRDEHGNLFPDPVKFPSGMLALADYVHARGLKFGIYSDAGSKTCGGQPGGMGHETQDAETFASWQIDFLKYDWCNAPDTRADAERLYSTMGKALQATGRPILFSICEWGHHRPWLWANTVGGHMWRTTGDIWDAWENGQESYHYGIDSIGFDQQRDLDVYAGPGGWNDPDMLVVGLHGKGSIGGSGCTDIEYRTHFSLWCMLAAPLMIGADIRKLDAVSFETLTNPEMIAIDQDPLGRQGYRVARQLVTEIWQKPLANGDLAVGLFNRSNQAANITAPWSDLLIDGEYQVRDLWQHKDMGFYSQSYSAEVESHGCVMLRLSAVK